MDVFKAIDENGDSILQYEELLNFWEETDWPDVDPISLQIHKIAIPPCLEEQSAYKRYKAVLTPRERKKYRLNIAAEFHLFVKFRHFLKTYKDGLSFEEFRLLLSWTRLEVVSKEECEEIFESVDGNSDNRIQFDEYCQMLFEHRIVNSVTGFFRMFSHANPKNKKEQILTIGLFEFMMTRLNIEEGKKGRFKMLFNNYDLDKNKYIDLYEFTSMTRETPTFKKLLFRENNPVMIFKPAP